MMWYCGQCGIARPNGCGCLARDTNTPPGYIPAANARRMEPIPVQVIDWGELSPLGDGPTTNANARTDGDGLVTNERADGGLPTVEIDWAALSAFRPQG